MNSPNPSLPAHSKLLRRSMWVSYILLALGLGFLGWLIYHLGYQNILHSLKLFGWNFLTALIPSVFFFILFTLSWDEFLKCNAIRVPFSKLFMVKVVGEAVNNASPLSWGGGDPVRIYLLKKWVPVAEGTASVVVDRTLNAIALVAFMMIGIVIAFLKFDLPPSFQIGFALSLAFMVGMTLYWYRRQHEGVFEFLVDTLKRLRIKRNWSEDTLKKVSEIDALISRFYKQDRLRFALAFFYQFLIRLLGVAEIYLAAYFLGAPLDWIACYLLASLTAIINMIFVFIPGSVGVMEGAYAGIFHLIHQDPAVGTSIQIFRRIRMILWAVPGFYYIYHQDRKTRLELQELAHRAAAPEIEIDPTR